MRAVVQRASGASVRINGNQERSIGPGMVILLGIEHADELEDAKWLSRKIAGLRIFTDDAGKLNVSLNQVKGEIMIISQFTLHASIKKGTRPSYVRAAPPEQAKPLYEAFIKHLSEDAECRIVTGEFGAQMDVELVNNGPVTIIIDTKNRE
jgi:D-tyrosyl-tRNA(Tyr) deacylase